jgi:hypothetical protein
MTDEPELECVRTCQGWHVGQIYKSKLEAAGIPVLLNYESAGLVFGITVDGLGQVRVMVPKNLAADARAVLEGSEWGDGQGSDEEPPLAAEPDVS